MVSIYDKYGGQPFWDHIMNEFYAKNVADPTLQGFYIGKDLERIKRMNEGFLALALKPSEEHFMVSVKRSHRNMEIFGNHFNNFVSNLARTVAENGVTEKDAQEILCVIESFRADLVKD